MYLVFPLSYKCYSLREKTKKKMKVEEKENEK